MRAASRSTILLLFLCFATSLSFGWGCSGHQIVALIAEKNLTPNARQAVLDLLGGTPIDPALKRFCGPTSLGPMADVSTWADDFRETNSTTSPWHYWDVPLIADTKPNANDFCEKGCVARAIEDQLKILGSPDARREDKVKALMFVIHFMGDMHQPLHLADNNDRGGNCIPVAFFELQTKLDDKGNSFPNLHGIWDTAILERIAGIRRETHDADVKYFADELSRRFAASIVQWRKGPVDVQAWAWEVHQVARTMTYAKLPAPIIPEQPVAISSCADDNNIGQRMLAQHEHIDQPYVTLATPVIEQQLVRAGARLANVLNQSFASH